MSFLSSALGIMENLMHGVLEWSLRMAAKVARPVMRNQRFFVVMSLLGMMSPLAFILLTGDRLLTILLLTCVQSVTEAYLMSLLVQAVRNLKVKRTVEIVLLAVWGLVAVAEIGLIAMTGAPITVDSVALLLETTVAESAGFMMQYFRLSTLVVLIMAGLVIAAVCLAVPYVVAIIRRLRWLGMWCVMALVVMLVCGTVRLVQQLRVVTFSNYDDLLAWISEGPENPMLMRAVQLQYADPVVKGAYVYKYHALQLREISGWENIQQEVLASRCDGSGDRDFNIVLIIGESMVRSHSSLYGYYLQTNPRLSAERDSNRLVVFSDMMTVANYTTPSLRNMFNLNDLAAGEKWVSSAYFPLLIKRGGWHVYHYDNQTVSRDSDTGIARVFYSPINMKHTYDGISDSIFEYDGDYVDYVGRKLMPNERDGKKFVIYHVMGQHFPAVERYPGPGRFSVKDITVSRPWLNAERRMRVAEFDNAMAYNDSVVGAIIDQRSDGPTILFYFSDHGEDCWDLAPMEARNKQMPEDKSWLDRQYHVPFMVWMSDSFMAQYPDLAQRIRRAATRKGMLDNFGQFVLGISGIRTQYYRPTRDISSQQYQPKKRTTINGYELD